MRAVLGAEQKAARVAAAAVAPPAPPPPVDERTPAPPPVVEEQIELPRPRPEYAAAVGLAAGELEGWIERQPEPGPLPFGDSVLARTARDLQSDQETDVDQVAGGALAEVVRNDEARQAREAAQAEALARDGAAWERRLADLVAAARTIARRVLGRIERPPAPGPVRPAPAGRTADKDVEPGRGPAR